VKKAIGGVFVRHFRRTQTAIRLKTMACVLATVTGRHQMVTLLETTLCEGGVT
jgi:hypothetical protein